MIDHIDFIERKSGSIQQIENFQVWNLTKSRLQPEYQNLLKENISLHEFLYEINIKLVFPEEHQLKAPRSTNGNAWNSPSFFPSAS